MPQVLTPVIEPAILQQAEAVLWASGSQYRAGNPLNSAATRTALGLGSAATEELTDWVSYTPTFTGLGTVASVSVWSRRIGDTLHLRGKFTVGTPTATEARMTLGFNGVNGGITSDATKVSSIQYAGSIYCDGTTPPQYIMLIESNIGYVTFGRGDASNSILTKRNGSDMFAAGRIASFVALLPISGW